MKFLLIIISLFIVVPATAQGLTSGDPSDALMTIQPTSDASYTENFAARRKAVAMRDDPKMSAIDKGRAAVGDFAQCLYDSDKGGSRRVLLSAPGQALKAAVSSFANGQCWLRGFLSFRPSTFQGALFNVAYRSEFRSRSSELPSEPLDYTAIVDQADPTRAASFVALRRFGDCAVRSNVAAARRAVLSDVASNAEIAAFSELAPGLSGCITAGQSVTLSKKLVKSIMAEVLYRYAILDNSSRGGR